MIVSRLTKAGQSRESHVIRVSLVLLPSVLAGLALPAVVFADGTPVVPTPKKKKAKPLAPKDDGFLAGERAFNSCARIKGNLKVKVTLKPQSSVADLVGWISSMTCRRFIVPSNLRSQAVTVLAPTAITRREAYRLFVSALRAMGLTVVPAGRALKVVAANWAVQAPLPLYQHRDRRRVPFSDAPVTQLYRPQHIGAASLMPLLHKLKSRAGDVSLFAPTNTLIVTDGGLNVRRMVKVASALDVAGPRRSMWIVKPRYIEASELAKLLQQVLAKQSSSASGPSRIVGARTAHTRRRAPAARGQRAGSSSAQRVDLVAPLFVAETHSNSLIISADAPTYRRAMALMAEVDVKPEAVRSRLWVYRLKHAKAEELVKALGRIVSAGSAQARSRTRGNRRRPAVSKAQTSGSFSGPIKIDAEKTNNALLVYASASDYLSLRPTIAELDQPRRQVFIEAHIMEVSIGKGLNLGLASHAGAQVDGTTILGGLSHGGDLNSLTSNPATLTGLAMGVLGKALPGVSVPGVSGDVPSFGLVIEALQSRSRAKVLSSPHLLTTDNEKATISVGDKVPVRQGIAASALSGSGQDGASVPLSLVQPINRELVGLKLSLTPTIGQGDSVRLQIEQEASEVTTKNYEGGLGVATSERKVDTVVTVRHGQTVVIGGLMKTKVVRSRTQIPILGDIPLLGVLFRRTTMVRDKVNLMIVLTPYIIRDRSDLRRIFRRKLKERARFMRRWMHAQGTTNLAEIDFRHKRGMLALINQVGLEQESKAEQAKLAAAEDGKKQALQSTRIAE
jgi:general secretion pathway protein D